jgi:outer membrane protein TolC
MSNDFYRRRTALKTPTIARLLSVFLVFFPATLQAQTWDENQFVKHGLSLVSQERIQNAEQNAIKAEVARDTAHALPNLTLEYEPTWGETRRDEFVVGLSQTFDVSTWRSDLRKAAKLRHDAAALNTRSVEQELANKIRLAFWNVRLQEDRLQVYTDVQARFNDALRIIEARANAGDASGLDVMRIQRQLELIRTEALAQNLQLEDAWSQLDEWRADGNRPTITGTITPQKTSFSIRENPTLKQLELEKQALSLEAEAWGSPGLRNWEVGAGYRFENDQDAAHGVLVSLTIPLALWNIDAPQTGSLQARKEVIDIQKNIVEKRLARAIDSTQLRLNKAIAALDSTPEQPQDAQLSELVAKAYAADEASLFDLIEALRSEVELGLARVELQWEARRAFIELQNLTSYENPQ